MGLKGQVQMFYILLTVKVLLNDMKCARLQNYNYCQSTAQSLCIAVYVSVPRWYEMNWEKNDFASREMGAAEPAIAPRSPPVTHTNRCC